MTPGEQSRECTEGRTDTAEVFVAPRPIEGRYRLLEAGDRPTIVTLGMVGYTKAVVGPCVQDDIPTSRGEYEGALGRSDGLIIHARKVEMD